MDWVQGPRGSDCTQQEMEGERLSRKGIEDLKQNRLFTPAFFKQPGFRQEIWWRSGDQIKSLWYPRGKVGLGGRSKDAY